MFDIESEEDSIRVVGGMAWCSNVLIVGCEERDGYFVSFVPSRSFYSRCSSRFFLLQIRMFGRDRPLSLVDSLGAVALDSKPLIMAVFDSSLLVYTADNTFHHFLIKQTAAGVTRLKICGSIGFEGVLVDPSSVRGMSWLVPKSQQRTSHVLSLRASFPSLQID